MRDEGFDLPDVRDEYITKDGGTVSITISRHWYNDEDGEMNFKVSFDIHHRSEEGQIQRVQLPIGTDESKALAVAKELWPEDEEASEEIADLRAQEAAERRAGA